MSEEPKHLMRFVGVKEDGSNELKRASPGGFKRNELRELPFAYSLEPYWDLVDDVPDLVLPEEKPEDSVFEEEHQPQLKYVLPVEQAPEEVAVIHYDTMTVKTLKLFIEQRGGTVDRKWRKADLVEEARKLQESLSLRTEASNPDVIELDSIEVEGYTGEDHEVVTLKIDVVPLEQDIDPDSYGDSANTPLKEVLEKLDDVEPEAYKPIIVCPEGSHWDEDEGMCMPDLPDGTTDATPE